MERLGPAKIQCEYCKRTILLDGRYSPWDVYICGDEPCKLKCLDSIKIPVICEPLDT